MAERPTNAEAARYCAEQVRRFDPDRHLCTLFLPEAARPAALAIHAFNVEVARIRELVREPLMGQIRLQWWREALEAPPRAERNHPVAIALGAAIRAHDLSLQAFMRLLDARERDLSDEPPESLDALIAYADATAGTLVQLTLEVLGARDAASQAAGRDVGIAWALTGLLRAVAFHARQRRLYLPRDLLAQAGIAPEQVFEGRAGEALVRIARLVVQCARDHLAVARARRATISRAAVPGLLPAVLAEYYLDRLASGGFALFDPATQREGNSRALRLAWAALRGRY